jgi:hypothetical protein
LALTTPLCYLGNTWWGIQGPNIGFRGSVQIISAVFPSLNKVCGIQTSGLAPTIFFSFSLSFLISAFEPLNFQSNPLICLSLYMIFALFDNYFFYLKWFIIFFNFIYVKKNLSVRFGCYFCNCYLFWIIFLIRFVFQFHFLIFDFILLLCEIWYLFF